MIELITFSHVIGTGEVVATNADYFLTLTHQERLIIKRVLAHEYQECIRKGHKGGADIIKGIMLKLK